MFYSNRVVSVDHTITIDENVVPGIGFIESAMRVFICALQMTESLRSKRTKQSNVLILRLKQNIMICLRIKYN